MGKARILYIHHGSARAGAFISLMSMLDGIDRSRFEITVCSAEDDSEVLHIAESAGYDVCASRLGMFAHVSTAYYRPWRADECASLIAWSMDYGRARKRLEGLLDRIKPDILHFNSLTLAPYARVPHDMGIPVIVHVRESIADGMFGFRKAWLRRHLSHSVDKVICICRDNSDRLLLPPGKCEVIYNPVDFSRFDCRMNKSEARRLLGISDDAKAVLFAGGSDPVTKGLYDFLKAMMGLSDVEPKLTCLMPGFSIERDLAPKWTFRRRAAWLMGLYKQRDGVRRELTSSSLAHCIVQGDFTREIEKWIAASDVVCVPHIVPHFSRAVGEAGAMKRPVVAYRIGAVEEVVSHGETGLLVEQRDVSALSNAVNLLLKNPGPCLRLGEAGYNQARRFFSSDESARQVQVVYSDLLRVCAGRPLWNAQAG